MPAIANISLRARPDDRIHLLLWDTPEEAALQDIAFYNYAHRVNYRQNLLSRIDPNTRYLALHQHQERELASIKCLGTGVDKQIVLIENLDCLIAYLQMHPSGHMQLFWSNLEKTRKLEKTLWILLPRLLAPKTWPEERIQRI